MSQEQFRDICTCTSHDSATAPGQLFASAKLGSAKRPVTPVHTCTVTVGLFRVPAETLSDHPKQAMVNWAALLNVHVCTGVPAP